MPSFFENLLQTVGRVAVEEVLPAQVSRLTRRYAPTPIPPSPPAAPQPGEQAVQRTTEPLGLKPALVPTATSTSAPAKTSSFTEGLLKVIQPFIPGIGIGMPKMPKTTTPAKPKLTTVPGYTGVIPIGTKLPIGMPGTGEGGYEGPPTGEHTMERYMENIPPTTGETEVWGDDLPLIVGKANGKGTVRRIIFPVHQPGDYSNALMMKTDWSNGDKELGRKKRPLVSAEIRQVAQNPILGTLVGASPLDLDVKGAKQIAAGFETRQPQTMREAERLLEARDP